MLPSKPLDCVHDDVCLHSKLLLVSSSAVGQLSRNPSTDGCSSFTTVRTESAPDNGQQKSCRRPSQRQQLPAPPPPALKSPAPRSVLTFWALFHLAGQIYDVHAYSDDLAHRRTGMGNQRTLP